MVIDNNKRSMWEKQQYVRACFMRHSYGVPKEEVNVSQRTKAKDVRDSNLPMVRSGFVVLVAKEVGPAY